MKYALPFFGLNLGGTRRIDLKNMTNAACPPSYCPNKIGILRFRARKATLGISRITTRFLEISSPLTEMYEIFGVSSIYLVTYLPPPRTIDPSYPLPYHTQRQRAITHRPHRLHNQWWPPLAFYRTSIHIPLTPDSPIHCGFG